MAVLERRLQVLIDDERYARLSFAARARGVSVATVVREAIDASLAAQDDERRAAIESFLAAEPMPVPEDPADLIAELNEIRYGGL